nr:phospholipase D-like domain-containing protein [Myxococcus sp. RHSTA-1-4]
MDGGTERHIDRAACLTHNVADTYRADNPKSSSWLEADTFTFRKNGGGGVDTVVKLEDITRVEGDLHIYTCVQEGSWNRIYTHSKVAIIDDQWLIVGSANWSYRSMQYDGEISAFIDNPGLAQAALQRLLGHYDEVTALDVNNIEAEACTNLAGALGTNAVRQAAIANRYIVLPLNHVDLPNFGFPRVRPGVMDAPNYTWI